MKKIAAVITAGALLLGLTGCVDEESVKAQRLLEDPTYAREWCLDQGAHFFAWMPTWGKQAADIQYICTHDRADIDKIKQDVFG